MAMSSQIDADLKLAENLIYQARNFPVAKLEEFYDKFMKSSDSVDNLKQLYLLLHSDHKKLLPEEITTVLLANLCNPKTNILLKEQCGLILAESSPNSAITMSEFLDSNDNSAIINTIRFSLLQGEQCFWNPDVQNAIVRLCDSKESSYGLRLTRQLCQLCDTLNIDDDIMNPVATSLSSYITKASRIQAANPSQSSRFWQSETAMPITELDGTPSSELFTVLNLAQYNTPDQFANIHAFSTIYPLLPHILKSKTDPNILAENRAKTLIASLTEYCLRIMDQAERIALKFSDSNLQQATLTEAIKILDIICEDNVDLIVRIFPKIRKCISIPYLNNLSRNSQLSVRLASLTFILNHGDTISRDPRVALEQFFAEEISTHIWNQMESALIILFIRKNLEKLCYNTTILETYFPNIFKGDILTSILADDLDVLAWHPITFLNDFLVILPSFMSTNTATEIFNSILDLPCVTSSLLLTRMEQGDRDIPKNTEVPSKLLWQEFVSPANRSMFNFVLRKSSGQGDTFDRVGLLHGMIYELTGLPRVKASISIVVPLLKVYFDTVLEHCDATLSAKLLPAMLERINLLFTFPTIQVEIQELIAKNLGNLIHVYPNVLVEAQSEITDYLATMPNFSHSFYTNLVTLIGQYIAGGNPSICRLETVTSFYETLECVIYELLSAKDRTWSDVKPRTVSITVATLAKLAVKCQDLIPRVQLCLTKVQQQARLLGEDSDDPRSYEWSIVNSRTTDLIAVLRHPSLASAVLSTWPATDRPKRLHDDSTSVTALLRTITFTMACSASDNS